MSKTQFVYPLQTNRVWRSYGGGKILDKIEGKSEIADSHFPEDWIFSTTQAVNPGREQIIEGISQVQDEEGKTILLTDLIARSPDGFLGSDYVKRYGQKSALLVKFLDSAVRLHFQVHPTVAFSKQYLNADYGKTETYHILGFREGLVDPYIYMGFQRPPSVAEFKQVVEAQDMTKMESYFDKIPVAIGDTFIIPGGLVHAIGEGVLMVEIMESSDFVARLEFEKYGYVLPEVARFMDRGIDFGLSMIKFDALSREDILEHYRSRPEVLRKWNEHSFQEKLIWEKHTNCFSINRTSVKGTIKKSENSFYVGIVTSGQIILTSGGRKKVYPTYDKFFVPASAGEIEISSEKGATVLEAYPPRVSK
jgi:mannose-6-phosphate isomerase